MRIDVRDSDRRWLFRATVDLHEPADAVRAPDGGREVYLSWDKALDADRHLRRCPVCGCRELFARRDFPQAFGFGIVVLAAVAATVLFAMGLLLVSVAVLASVAVIDAVVVLFTGRCLVCYRCRSEFRALEIPKDHAG